MRKNARRELSTPSIVRWGHVLTSGNCKDRHFCSLALFLGPVAVESIVQAILTPCLSSHGVHWIRVIGRSRPTVVNRVIGAESSRKSLDRLGFLRFG